MFNKKHQILLVQEDGRLDFVEFQLTYHTSSMNYNHAQSPDLSYTSVVDNNFLNLTPLGKFVMPPPMSEKQVPLPDTDAPCSCLTMYGHTVVAIANKKIYTFDCLREKEINTFNIPQNVIASEVYKLLAYKNDKSEIKVVMIEN